MAIGWAAVRDWLYDVERYTSAASGQARPIVPSLAPVPRTRHVDDRAPRRLFGLAFECRPPPLPA